MKIINEELHKIFMSNLLTDEDYRNKTVKFFWNEFLNQKSATKIIGCRKCKLCMDVLSEMSHVRTNIFRLVTC